MVYQFWIQMKLKRELNLFCVISDRKNVLIPRTNENKRSGMAWFTQIWKLNIFGQICGEAISPVS